MESFSAPEVRVNCAAWDGVSSSRESNYTAQENKVSEACSGGRVTGKCVCAIRIKSTGLTLEKLALRFCRSSRGA